jgi:hypothetical protein
MLNINACVHTKNTGHAQGLCAGVEANSVNAADLYGGIPISNLSITLKKLVRGKRHDNPVSTIKIRQLTSSLLESWKAMQYRFTCFARA